MAAANLCKFCLYEEVPEKCYGCFFKPVKKPPLGVMPRFAHDELRLRALRQCIANYMQAGLTLLPEWIEEYNELIKRKETANENNL